MEDIERITKENHDRQRLNDNYYIQKGYKTYGDTLERSVIRSTVRKSGSRKKVIKAVKIRLAAAVLALTAAVALTNYAVKNHSKIDNPITAITETIENNKRIDEKIKDYEKIMGRKQEFEIESSNSKDENYKDLVYYDEQNINNLVTVITEASKKSEEETRCAVLAAFRIINEPYREEVLNEAFKQININQEETNFTVPNTLNNYLEKLGYTNLEEYRNNERKNIKSLEQTEIKTEGKIM